VAKLSELLGIWQIVQRISARWTPWQQPSPLGIDRPENWLRIIGYPKPFSGTHQNQSLTMLRYAVLRRIQNLPRQPSSVPGAREFLYEFFQKAPMFPNCQAFNIFEDKVGGPQFGHNAYEVSYKSIARVVQRPMANH
jgi:hypothetical protein